jgi:hypothetical protein
MHLIMWFDHQIKDLVDHWPIIVWMQLLDLEIRYDYAGFTHNHKVMHKLKYE